MNAFFFRKLLALTPHFTKLTHAIPKSSISKISVEPAGMPGCENLP
jgi:hypothetical protein